MSLVQVTSKPLRYANKDYAIGNTLEVTERERRVLCALGRTRDVPPIEEAPPKKVTPPPLVDEAEKPVEVQKRRRRYLRRDLKAGE